jgi:hypothetical protein
MTFTTGNGRCHAPSQMKRTGLVGVKRSLVVHVHDGGIGPQWLLPTIQMQISQRIKLKARGILMQLVTGQGRTTNVILQIQRHVTNDIVVHLRERSGHGTVSDVIQLFSYNGQAVIGCVRVMNINVIKNHQTIGTY